MGSLSDAVERVRKELERDPPPENTLLLRTRSAPPPLDVAAPLRVPGVSIIAAIKRASPPAGQIGEADVAERVEAYERGGAAVISVFTEPRYFHGSLLDLRVARRRCRLPLLRNDFIVHPVQVLEARAEGADGVVLIVTALTRNELRNLIDVAHDLGMAAVIQGHSPADVEAAVASDADVIAVSGRDPESWEVRGGAALDLAREVPHDRLLALDGAISTRRQVVEAEESGVDAVIVGEALMRSPDPARTIRRLRGALTSLGGAREPGT
jgi:indole-3-glycerol phosphate synthase